MDEFVVHDDYVACENCGKLYNKPKPFWTFDMKYDTYRGEYSDKKVFKPIN